ncbi:MAG: DUF4111 domain-containing protein [Patescibacteria group bacterium]|nr:DUF4111 domain-containing protein [Patescibacteria group bacterium]
MEITVYPDVNKVLDELLFKIQSTLGNKLVGLYLYGSLVDGDFEENVSDIDLLVALESDLDGREFELLKEMHEEFEREHKKMSGRIDVQYISVPALKTFKSKISRVATISLGEQFQIKEVGKHWLMNWYMVRKDGKTLFGPCPKTIIEPVSKEEFIDSVKDHVKSWNKWVQNMHTQYGQAYAILTLSRALYAYKNGEQVSKTKAAIWAKQKIPQWAELIQNALSWRQAGKDKQTDEKTYAKTEQFVNYVGNIILTE